MFTSKVVEGHSITPLTDNAAKMIELLALQGADGLKAAKNLPNLFQVAEVDYCAMLDKPANVGDLQAALIEVGKAVNTGDPVIVKQAYDEYSGALNTACDAIRKQYGVSSRYQFNVITQTWTRREATPRKPAEVTTVGEAKPGPKVLTHRFIGNDGFAAEDANGGKLYATVKAHYEPTWKPTANTDFQHTALPYFAKVGKYDSYQK